MKTTAPVTTLIRTCLRPRAWLRVLAAMVVPFAAANQTLQAGETNFVAHEWGTFTSVQGGDGKLRPWKPLETSRLPGFVYDWENVGGGRVSSSPFGTGPKPAMITLQRMETPVLYFYSDRETSVDVTVRFPNGKITEWFPQATEIGPSFVPLTSRKSTSAAPGQIQATTPAFDRSQVVDESLIHWSGVRILPPAMITHPDFLPQDRAGSHYFTARDTDSTYISLDAPPAGSHPEHEKFLFYRGVGNFATPLTVTIKAGHCATLANHGKEPLGHLILLTVRGGTGHFSMVDTLAPESQTMVPDPPSKTDVPLAELVAEVAARLSAALAAEGLYPREAEAMVNTWRDSWLTEEGTRVLYPLPRAWTDRTLPLRITPSPKEVVRVMMGRAEIITPGTESEISQLLNQMKKGDASADARMRARLKELGRFAEPALDLALGGKNVDERWRESLLAGTMAPEEKRN